MTTPPTLARALIAAGALCAAASAQLIWSDEFNGPAGQRPDPAKWTYDLGGGGWGNRELEVYTDAAENASLDGNGNLMIRALRDESGRYSSARLKTLGKFEAQYGRVEARIQLPFGQGTWPAFWMLGATFPEEGWPRCGEIDVMEQIGKEPATMHGTVHGPGYSGANGISGLFQLPEPARFRDGFHVFGIEWAPGAIRFSVDGTQYHQVTPGDLPAGAPWVLDRPFFLLLNLAVGGNWPGSPDISTLFPQKMYVDYVRVFQKK